MQIISLSGLAGSRIPAGRKLGPYGILSVFSGVAIAALLSFSGLVIEPENAVAAAPNSAPAAYPASKPIVDSRSPEADYQVPYSPQTRVEVADAALPEVGQTAAIAGKDRMAASEPVPGAGPAKAGEKALATVPATGTGGATQPGAVKQADSAKSTPQQPAAKIALQPAAAKAGTLSPDWAPLVARLKKDGAYGEDVEKWFCALENGLSDKPMGSKISSVFNYRYRPFKYLRKPVKSPTMLPQVHVQSNIVKCADFLLEHADMFEAAEKRFKVDRGIVVALLMVETRLGTYMGGEHAFWSLSCMALSDKPEHIQSYLNKMYLTKERRAWVAETMQKRSEWAYKELVALIGYCRKYGHDALAIQGSPYGAIGLCQFMPSNIDAYGVDGNGDGVIDLFTLEDAIPSIASYISKHGWKPGLDRAERHKIIRRYNHSDMYANTVLALSDSAKAYLVKNPQGSKTPKPEVKKAAEPAKAKATAKAAPKSASKAAAKPQSKTTAKTAAKAGTKTPAKASSTSTTKR
ncbi:lytic murein transglycosylase [Desulfovibrio sp. OttesenSCG-928-C06]|nr:lytic murein transglycosylase [Desulfovibrio sp. OttesenSCG-928-C06]